MQFFLFLLLGINVKFTVDILLNMMWLEFNLGCPIKRFAIIACVAGCRNMLLVHFLYKVKGEKLYHCFEQVNGRVNYRNFNENSRFISN